MSLVATANAAWNARYSPDGGNRVYFRARMLTHSSWASSAWGQPGGGLKTPGYVLRVYAVRLNAGGAVPHDDGDSFKVCIGVVSVPVELIVCWVE